MINKKKQKLSKSNNIIWEDKYNNGNLFIGIFNEEIFFEIKKGLLTFSLKIIHKKLNKINKNSVELKKLQNIAEKILYEYLRKIKTFS